MHLSVDGSWEAVSDTTKTAALSFGFGVAILIDVRLSPGGVVRTCHSGDVAHGPKIALILNSAQGDYTSIFDLEIDK